METKNFIARCIDMQSNDEFVAHEVEFDEVKGGELIHHIINIQAIDPIHAIKQVKVRYEHK
jgi:hypothetical protein